jgi:gliding motility-associated-like protein
VENNQIIYVPNAFSPNGDGLNDVLRVFGVSIKSINFSIFDRWGEKIFSVETSDLNNGWDGTYRGKLLPPDVFVYYLDAEFEDGQRKQMKGSVTILR